MTTLARTRAETLFASMSTHSDRAIAPPALPPENTVKPRQTGPNTLHLPSGTLPNQAGWPVAKPRRVQKTSGLTRAW